jgi:hypothetical protein
LVVEPGTAELELPADVLSMSRPDLADLRISRGGSQVPYVAGGELLHRTLAVNLTAEPHARASHVSAWRLETPEPGLPIAAVRIDTTQPTFERSVRWLEVLETRDGSRVTNQLAGAEWKRLPGPASRPLELVPGSRPAGRTTWIEIDDGDNPSLPALTATAEYLTRRVRFLASDGAPMELHYGNPEATAPRYDLALLADRLNASTRTVAKLGPASERRPGLGEAAMTGTGLRIVFWGVLGGVVIVLLAVIRRLLPEPPANGQSGP